MRAPASDVPVELEDVSVLAGPVALVDGVTMRLTPGAPTVLIGPNGAGKTTLLRIVMGLIAPSRGRVTWAGREHVAHPLAVGPVGQGDDVAVAVAEKVDGRSVDPA